MKFNLKSIIKIILLILALRVWSLYYYLIIPSYELKLVLKLFSILVGGTIMLSYLKSYKEWWKEILGWIFFTVSTSILCAVLYFTIYSLFGICLNFSNNNEYVKKDFKIVHIENTNMILDKISYKYNDQKFSFIMSMPNSLSNQNSKEYYLSLVMKELPFGCYYVKTANILKYEK